MMTTVGIMSGAEKPKSGGLIPAEPGVERSTIRKQLCDEWQAWCGKYRETNPDENRPLCKRQFETYCNPDEPNSDEPKQVFTVALSGPGTQTVPLIPEYPNTGLDEIENPKIKALEKERLVEICKFLNILNKTPIDMDSLLPIRSGIGFLTRTLDHYGLPTDLLRIKLKNISLFIVENSESVTENFREDLSSLLEGVDLRCEPILEYVNRQSFLNFVKRGGARRKQRRTRRRKYTRSLTR